MAHSCASPKPHPVCTFNNIIKLLIVRTGDAVLRLRRSRSLLPSPAAVRLSVSPYLVVERSFGWMSRFRRLARDYERLPETLAGLHYLAFVILMLKNVAEELA